MLRASTATECPVCAYAKRVNMPEINFVMYTHNEASDRRFEANLAAINERIAKLSQLNQQGDLT
jgi:hypothetical protein